jgi:probable O-glycosylation ligase (exosortase A-associated)
MLRTLLFLAILIPGLYAAFRSRHAALLLYFWYAFFRPQDWIWLDISGFPLSLFLGILLVVPSLLSGILPNLRHPLSVGAVVFFLSAAIAQFGAFDPAIGWYWLDFLARLLLVTLIATSLITDRRKFLLTLMVIALSFGFHASKAGLASLLAGGVRFTVGPGGAYSDNNGYGIAMAMILPFLICVAQNTTSKVMRWGCALAAPLVAFGVVGTYSRSAFLALIAGALTMMLFQPRRWSWMALVALLAVPLGLFMTQQDGYLERMATIQTYEETAEVSAASRPHFWRVAVDMAKDNPLGVGLFNYEAAYDKYDFLQGQFGQKRSVHSSHFQVLAETGIVGAAAWTFMFGYAVILVFRIRRRGFAAERPEDRQTYVTAAAAFMASMVAFLVGGSFIAMALNDLTWVTFALLAALDRISSGQCSQENEEMVPVAAPGGHPTLAPAPVYAARGR